MRARREKNEEQGIPASFATSKTPPYVCPTREQARSLPERPHEIDQLLRATSPAARDSAWEAFVKRYTPVLLSAIKTSELNRDDVMDAYAFALDALRANGGQRLAAFQADGRGSFTTWLTVVGRRLAVDFHRHRYGRSHHASRPSTDRRSARRRLALLVGADVSIEDIPAPDAVDDPPLELEERHDALAHALSALPARDRLLVRLRFEDDAPVREIARLMAFPSVFHVYRHIDRVLASLRAALEQAGIHHAAR